MFSSGLGGAREEERISVSTPHNQLNVPIIYTPVMLRSARNEVGEISRAHTLGVVTWAVNLQSQTLLHKNPWEE